MKEFYSTLDVSAICGVDPVTVARWCDRGDLKCYKTPGGHRRIRREDLLEFLQKHRMEVPADLQHHGLKVLAMAGDSKLLANLKRRYANHGGAVELVTAANGIEGLIRFGALSPQVVVIDLEAEGVDALEACRQISSCPGNKAKIIVLGAPAKEKQAMKAGATAFLAKPLDLKQLDSVLLPAAVAMPAAKS